MKSSIFRKYTLQDINIDGALSSELQKNKTKITKQAHESQGLES